MFPELVQEVLSTLAYLFVTVTGFVVLAVVVMFIVDIRQKEHAVRRNYPVIGRFRYLLENLGEFLRRYFYADDREEMPFNRAERAWVYRSAKGIDSTIAFGSTRDLRPAGTVFFLNTQFPVLDQDAMQPAPVTLGPYTRNPYTTRSLFNISGMSFGAISKPAVLALSHGARRAGVWMNTGEGGLSPHHLEGGADIVFQIGTAKYGVRDAEGYLSDERLRGIAAHEQVRMFELKLAQGAKPGKGGILPGAKVTAEIAAIRFIKPGEDSLSPNRHPEIRSAVDLLDMIGHIREVTGKPTGLKTVMGDASWLDDLCREILRRGEPSAPDFITLDSGDGGSGAAPMSLMDYVGLPLKESLPMLVDALTRHGLRQRIRVIASGKMITPGPAAWALCTGADFVVSARGFMFALGCIQALQCNRNTCPTGITTHEPRLQKGLVVADKTERVYRYAMQMHREIGMIAHACGVREPREMRRRHCRVVQANGLSIPLDELHPEPRVELGLVGTTQSHS